MSKLGDKVLTEKTRVAITITNFVLLMITIIGWTAFLVNWKSDIEHRLSSSEESIIIIDNDVDNIETAQILTQTKLAEIQTDLKWIKSYLIGIDRK